MRAIIHPLTLLVLCLAVVSPSVAAEVGAKSRERIKRPMLYQLSYRPLHPLLQSFYPTPTKQWVPKAISSDRVFEGSLLAS